MASIVRVGLLSQNCKYINLYIYYLYVGHAVAQLVEALRYKP
jgi:hypothetical protein